MFFYNLNYTAQLLGFFQCNILWRFKFLASIVDVDVIWKRNMVSRDFHVPLSSIWSGS